MNYNRHPSKRLNEIYAQNPYQGADPKSAKFIFIGRDPNWDIEIEQSDLFPYIEEYLSSGPQFWEKYDVHHPFLLQNYKGAGKRFHTMFSKIGINSKFSRQISFLELIGFPTIGNSSKNKKRFDKHLLSSENINHLEYVSSILSNSNKKIFIVWGVFKYMKMLSTITGLFSGLTDIEIDKLYRQEVNKVNNLYIHPHFSMGISNDNLRELFKIILSK